MSASLLDPLLAAPGLDASTALLERLSHAERRKLGAEVSSRLKALHDEPYSQTLPPRLQALTLVYFFCVPPSEWKRTHLSRLPEETAQVAVKLKAPGLEDAAERLVELNPALGAVARHLVRAGVSRRPSHDNYILSLLQVDVRFSPNPLDADPRVREDEVWHLFEVEGGGELSLAARDKYTPDDKTWAQTFLRHMRQGTLDRARLLDATLGALERDFAAFRAGWFSRFHQSMEPTHEELERHRERYPRLLGSTIPATVSLALDVVDTLDERRPFPESTLRPALEPVLLARHKAAAQQATKRLLALAGRETPDARQRVLLTLCMGLAHEEVDVQKAVFKALTSLASVPEAPLRAAVEERVEGVAASLRKQVQAWLGAVRETPAKAAPIEPPSNTGPASPCEPRFAVAPIEDLDSLIAAFSAGLEDASDPMELERILDGVARLGKQRPEDFARKTSALGKRAKKSCAKPYQEPLAFRLAGLALAWLAPHGQAVATLRELAKTLLSPAHEVFLPLLDERLKDLARALDAGHTDGLLSFPSHQGGWIAPERLVERVLARATEPTHTDLCIALSRLAPAEESRTAPPPSRKGQPHAETLKLIDWASGLGRTEPRAPEELLAVARRLRGDTEPSIHTFTVKARRSGEYTFHHLHLSTEPKPKATRGDLPGRMLSVKYGGVDKPYARWTATLWPSGMEAYFASRAEGLAENLDWFEASWGNAACYEQLLHPWLHLGPMARLVLALGLAAKKPGESGVSVDAAIAALETGRLSAQELGATMGELRTTGLVKLKRWTTTLTRVASASEQHARQVAVAIQRALRKSPHAAPRDEGSLVKLLLELLSQTETRLEDTEAWDYLRDTPHRKSLEALAPTTSSAAPPPPSAARRTTPRRAARRPRPAAR
ncbi:hypothetical protein SAMN05443572_102961 [Myxococcus fulvus]|uniref:HEAT repeat domain-containing protein n=1 Tax=Myxococcus fulvus TaxID=33 RepID=A0A511SVK6_MYXFU|nr:DUF6493 family protein [Myxococcus fulvus]GEN05921.1 hypothetical protein MFU01_09580 [Myxococcus fulvus]SET63484.1 hypothetical protein SAMN05443572_102961 [Myxococcus fulvus]